MAASSAQAATSTVTLGFPSMTLIQDAAVKPAIPVTYKVDGLNSALTGITLVPTITDKDGASVLGTTTATFFSDDTALNTQASTGVSAFNLQNGAQAAAFTAIPAGTYTFSVTAVSNSTGVAVATSSMPFAVVSTANAGTIAGSASFLDAQSLTATAVTSKTVATGSNVSAATPVYAAFLNAAGGPIVGAGALFTATAATTSATTTALGAGTAAAAAPGIYSFTYSGGDTWSATPGSGSIKAFFASPVNQITGTLPVTLSASATMTNIAIASAVEGTPTGSSAADDSTAVPATNGVKFTVAGITEVSSVATAGVPVTFTVAGRNDDDTAAATAYSAISPATATTVNSGVGGAVSLEYTVSNPVNNTGARVTATYPGGSKTFYIQFQTAVVTAVEVVTPVTAANSGDLTLSAAVVDQFGEPVPSLPVQAAVTGVGATSTPATLTTNASGEVSYTIAVPAGTVAGATSALTFTSWGGAAYNGPAGTINVTYVAGSAAVSALAVKGSFAGNATTYSALSATGKLNSATTPLFVNTGWNLASAYTPAADGFTWKIQGTATNASAAPVAGAAVTITAGDGGYVLNSSNKWVTSTTVFTDVNGLITAVLMSTKTGDISYNLTSGAVTSNVSAIYHNRATDARYVAISSSKSEVAAGTGATITAAVTDRFGNAVKGVTVTFGEEGPGYMAGSGTAVTNDNGTAEGTLVTVAGLNGTSSVTGTVASSAVVSSPQALPSSTDQTYANTTAAVNLQVGNAKDTVVYYANFPMSGAGTTSAVLGVTAGNASAKVDVKVEDASSKAITIAGSRTTVRGKPGILIEGVTTGIENGKTVIPYFRFPGQTSYTQGSARPEVQDDAFTWQRKTGKKFYAYVTNDDGAVQSNRVIIQAK